MTLEEAKVYKDKIKDSYIDKYLEFIYYNIKNSIDCGMDSCIVDFLFLALGMIKYQEYL